MIYQTFVEFFIIGRRLGYGLNNIKPYIKQKIFKLSITLNLIVKILFRAGIDI
jgi:hypothetical protein